MRYRFHEKVVSGKEVFLYRPREVNISGNYHAFFAKMDSGRKIFLQRPHLTRIVRCDMALTVNLYYTGKNGSARQFAEEMVSRGIVEAIRAQEGNERYEYFFPMEDEETVLLIDRWKNQEALDIHHRG